MQTTVDILSADPSPSPLDRGQAAIGASGPWRDTWRRLRRSPAAMVSAAVIGLYVLVALLAPLMLPDGQAAYDYDQINQPPSWRHLLGTDEFGRSVLIKTLLAARVSLGVAFGANLIAVPLGVVLGLVAGYAGRWADDGIVWAYTTVAAIPGILRVVALKFAFLDRVLWVGTPLEVDLSGMAGLVLALGLMTWVRTCRLVRAETMKIREMDFVLSARAIGRGRLAIMMRHILPNVMHLAVITFSLGFVGAILAEVTLSYLGLGVGVDTPSWGTMISASRMELVAGRWWQLAAALSAMFILVLSLHVLGDRLRDALSPTTRNGR